MEALIDEALVGEAWLHKVCSAVTANMHCINGICCRSLYAYAYITCMMITAKGNKSHAAVIMFRRVYRMQLGFAVVCKGVRVACTSCCISVQGALALHLGWAKSFVMVVYRSPAFLSACTGGQRYYALAMGCYNLKVMMWLAAL